MEPTYDRSNNEIEWGDEIPFDGSPLPAATDTPRTGHDAFRPGDHVHSLARRNDASRRVFGVMTVNEDGTLHIWSHRWGHIYRADPDKWERCLRNEEMSHA